MMGCGSIRLLMPSFKLAPDLIRQKQVVQSGARIPDALKMIDQVHTVIGRGCQAAAGWVTTVWRLSAIIFFDLLSVTFQLKFPQFSRLGSRRKVLTCDRRLQHHQRWSEHRSFFLMTIQFFR
jgi:hypothetical protein